MIRRLSRLFVPVCLLVLMAGCATSKNVDYTAFKASQPRSIVVLPPLNESADIAAGYSMLSQVTWPLAESGYYVLPVALVDETFRQNGLTVAGDIHGVPPAKLHEIFGADAALYITITAYGTQYRVIDSVTMVTASARLVDLRSGETLWTGQASASDANNNNSGGLTGALIGALVKQVINSSTDAGHQVALTASMNLLSAGHAGGILYGPRSPRYGTD